MQKFCANVCRKLVEICGTDFGIKGMVDRDLDLSKGLGGCGGWLAGDAVRGTCGIVSGMFTHLRVESLFVWLHSGMGVSTCVGVLYSLFWESV